MKLIRRGNIDTSVRMSKVEREIEVLRVCFSLSDVVFIFILFVDPLISYQNERAQNYRPLNIQILSASTT